MTFFGNPASIDSSDTRMTRRWMLPAAVLVALVVGVFMFSWSRGRAAPAVVESTAAQSAFWQDRFSKDVRKASRVGERARLVLNRAFRTADGTLGDEFVLGVGDTLRTPPDNHALATFQVDSVNDQGITFRYRAEFDHNSFGKNRVTVDRGTVLVPWKDPSTVPVQR